MTHGCCVLGIARLHDSNSRARAAVAVALSTVRSGWHGHRKGWQQQLATQTAGSSGTDLS